jgi:hypothetical protein
MLIRISVQRTQPLAGAAVIEGRDPVHFDGWLELLRVVSELVATAGDKDAQGDGQPLQANETGS